MRISRNDPCPCGSGKKYKKCCLASAEANDFEYRRQRNVEANLIRRITEYAFGLHELGTLEEAWHEFNDTDEVEMIQPDSPMNTVFMPWFLFSWVFDAADENAEEFVPTTNAESFAGLYGTELTADEWTFLESANKSLYSLREVIDMKPGVGMVLRDLFTNEEFDVVERLASQSLSVGHIIYCATIQIGDIKSNLATAPYPLRPTAKHDVLQLRKELLKEARKRKFSDELLIVFENDIRDLYLDAVDDMFAPPRLVNTDKEPMLFQKVYFDLKSVDQAFHRLKDLAGEESEEQLLRDANFNENRIVSVEIPWIGGSAKARKRHGGSILLGLLKLSDGQLVVEVNSTARAKKIRKIIEERIGDLASYKTTLLEPIEGALNEMWEEAKAAASTTTTHKAPRRGYAPLNLNDLVGESDDSASPFLDPNDPEVHQLMQQIAKEHWDTWFDIPIPALNNLTPREASRNNEGRDLLESLLLEYEVNNDASPDNLMRADIPALRRELGMEAKPKKSR